MLFQITWDFIDSSESGSRRTLQLFSKWQPGPAKFHGFYGYADGTGGVAIVEAASAADLARTMAPWVPYLHFDARVILPIQEATALNLEAMNWRDAIK